MVFTLDAVTEIGWKNCEINGAVSYNVNFAEGKQVLMEWVELFLVFFKNLIKPHCRM